MFSRLLLGAVIGAAIALPGAASAAEYTLRLAHAQPTKDVFHLGAIEFKKSLEADTGGKATVDIFPAGQLGKIRDMIEGLRVGTVQVVIDAPSRLAVYSKLGDVFKLPYLVENRAQLEKMYASDYGQKLLADLANASGISVVAVGWRGARNITSNREIHTPADMAGLKIRVPPYDLPVAIFKTLGASPTPMAFNEVYLALQQGVIDAQENPMSTNWSNRLHEVTKYLILTGHIKDAVGVMMGNAYLQGLPADIRAAVDKAAAVAAKFVGDYNEREEQTFIKNFADAGVKVITPDQAAFKAKFKGFIANYDPKLGEFADKVEAAK